MTKQAILFCAVVAFVLIIQSCQAAIHTVTIGPSLIYSPQNITIARGDTVNFVYAAEESGHTVTESLSLADKCKSLPGGFDSGVIPEGESFSVKFDNTGTTTFFCNVGPHCDNGQWGNVIVN